MQVLPEDTLFETLSYLSDGELKCYIESNITQISLSLLERLCIARKFPKVDNLIIFVSFLYKKKNVWKYTAKTFDIEFIDRVIVDIKRDSQDYMCYVIYGAYYHGLDFMYHLCSRILQKETLDSILDGNFDSELVGNEVYDYIAFSAYTSEEVFCKIVAVDQSLHYFWSVLAILGNKPDNIEHRFSLVDGYSKIEKWLAKVGGKECFQSYLNTHNPITLINMKKFDKYTRTDLISMFLLWHIEVSLSDCEEKAQNTNMITYLKKVRQVLTL